MQIFLVFNNFARFVSHRTPKLELQLNQILGLGCANTCSGAFTPSYYHTFQNYIN